MRRAACVSSHRAGSMSGKRRRAFVLLGALVAVLAWPAVRAAPQASDDDTADCIAVMEVTAGELARQIKAGNRDLEPALRVETLRAAALVGSVYFDGMHDERTAKARLNEARERQKGWDDERRARVHGACVQRADAELAAASGAERFVIERVAEVRMRRMLKKP